MEELQAFPLEVLEVGCIRRWRAAGFSPGDVGDAVRLGRGTARSSTQAPPTGGRDAAASSLQ